MSEGADPNPTKNYSQSDGFGVGTTQIAAYMFAGLAMMLNIRLSYSAAPFALLRFKLPENLFSVFVRTTSSALELWCIPSMLIGNIMEQVYNKTQNTTGPHATSLKEAAGTSSGDEGKLWKLAKELNENANSLEGAAPEGTTDDEALKQKAGANDQVPGTLRYLAKTLYNAAKALATAVTEASGTDNQASENLANAIGDKDEAPSGGKLTNLRQALAQLASRGQASDVTSQYSTVEGRFQAVQRQDTSGQYTGAAKAKYQEVKAAWNAFDKVYKANLKNFAQDLKNAVGEESGPGLQGALKNLNSDGSTDNALEVIKKFNNVADKYNKVKELGDTYKAIGATQSPYNNVETKFTDLQKKYSEAIYKYKFYFLTIPSMITNWLNFLTFVILFIIYVTGGDQGHVTGYYWIMAISGFVFGINMVLVYAVDYRYLPFYMAGENSFPMVTSLILYFATSIFGNRRKYNSDYLVVVIDVSIAIVIAFVASVLWTWAFYNYRTTMYDDQTPNPWPLISPVAMVIVGMGLVYSIYPGIAPGMIVPFYLIDKIEMVLLVATAFPPVIIAILRKYAENWSPQTKFVFPGFGGWTKYTDGSTTVHAYIWHLFDILIPLKISLAIIFIYSLHYRDSSISRAIVNQPKMSTALTITFYMCHEILLALGFPGMVGNGGAGGAVLLPTQYAGALLMVFLAFYSIGYITEYKKHDPSRWPTDGMTKLNALCYWLKMASKITNKNFKQLFTTDLNIY
ncbi:Tpr-related protein family member, putative [Theileria annulata]|uniref:Tpr-related protein family member, putative n=1 Tax=Theileria annulata TaxID=5874 RepID=Q4UHZ9_THEAN|nr:Tpr-related protein family member, putative [Theileria annulata]CAI73290.1 Tpr-related protein family member, putative [Theileria annulata]|eukprot:XP_953967.1 Tpr-related protein family member, putative [Theileria annulata]